MKKVKSIMLTFPVTPDMVAAATEKAETLGISRAEYLRRLLEDDLSLTALADQSKMPMLAEVPRRCMGQKGKPEYKCGRQADPRGDQCGYCWYEDSEYREQLESERQERQARNKRQLGGPKLY